MKLKLYYHLSCPTSLKLIRLLIEKELIKNLEAIDVGKKPLTAISRGLILVPAIEKKREIINCGPVNIENILNAFAEKKVSSEIKEASPEDIIDFLVHDILDNLFLSLIVYLRESILPILDYTPSISKLTRLYKTELSTSVKILERKTNKYMNLLKRN